ncbi:MAG: protein-S-isoprenylcysteine O-methyltransferase [Planctomycetota bacterium]|nr:protein-S-isoprenylcysteine O-methyltransferase [Planctomycetota bacterium]
MAILQPWNLIFTIGFVIYVATRGKFAAGTKGNESMDRRVGLQEKILLPVVISTSLLFPIIYLFTPLFSFADYELPNGAHAYGLVFMIVGLWLFWRSHVDLGLNWSPTLETREGHEIVKHGVYRRIRHPMYSAIWLFSIAQGLLLNNWLAGWAVVLAFAVMYFLRTPKEEEMMIDHFGSAYKDYMAETGRLFPRVRQSTSNESKSVG